MRITLAITCLLAAAAVAGAAPEKIKVIADQDSAGPQGTNFLSLLMLLNAPQLDVLGITTVSGDQWMEPATVFTLHAVELTGRTDVPVIKGAAHPLLNSRREVELRDARYGSHHTWRGVYNPDTPSPDHTWEPPGGYPKIEAHPGRAADFIIDTIRAHPGEVVLYMAGPLTNLALAVRMDPGIVPLVKAVHIMGASTGGGFELNWWWDPEAATIVMREPWKEIVITPGEIGFQIVSNEAMMRRIVEAGGPLADHVREQYLEYEPGPGGTHWSAMWDELAVAALIDPGLVTKTEKMWLDVDITHGPKYGHTVVWREPGEPSFFLSYSGPGPIDLKQWEPLMKPPTHVQPATVQTEFDVAGFEALFVELMSAK